MSAWLEQNQRGRHVYGRTENGGTATWYVSSVPFDEIDRAIMRKPRTGKSQPVAVPPSRMPGPVAGADLATGRCNTCRPDRCHWRRSCFATSQEEGGFVMRIERRSARNRLVHWGIALSCFALIFTGFCRCLSQSAMVWTRSARGQPSTSRP